MLNIIGVILVLVQFLMDGISLAHGGRVFAEGIDLLKWYAPGLSGVVLLLIFQAVQNHRIRAAEQKAEHRL